MENKSNETILDKDNKKNGIDLSSDNSIDTELTKEIMLEELKKYCESHPKTMELLK